MAGTSVHLSSPMPATADPRSLRKLHDAVVSMRSELDLRRLLLRIVRHAVDLVDAIDGALGVLDETGTRVVLRVTTEDSRYVSATGPPVNQWFVGLLVANSEPTRLPRAADDPRYDSDLMIGLPRTFLGVPIWARSRVFGHLYLTDKTTAESFTPIDEALLVSLAAAAGVAVENAERHAERVRRRATRMLEPTR